VTGKKTSPFDTLAPDAYFVTRCPPSDAGAFESSYWGVVADPDGAMRDRLAERDRFLAGVASEQAAIAAVKPGRILDVGCGPGFLLSAVGAGWEKHGVELSKLAADHARAHARIHNGPLADAAYPDGHFDVVVLHHVIEHVADPSALVREIRRVLAADGLFILATPNFDSGCARRFGEKYRLLHDKTHVTLFSDDSMRRFLRDNGFRIERSDYPYFETPYFTEDNLLRMLDTDRVSPPFYGNFMTFYCRKMTPAEAEAAVVHTLAALLPLALAGRTKPETAVQALLQRALRGLKGRTGRKKA
jgi:SAM-dependent methyltransferase